ncbi:hypothetical protein Tco_1548572 [Tanacetum coccineum]
MCRRESIREALLEVEVSEISINFKAKRSFFSRTFSLVTLDGYGKVVLALGITTGSSIWTIRGWTSLVLSLGSTVSFVTTVSKLPTTEVEFELARRILGCYLATSGDTPEVEVFVLTLATIALLRELRTLDLLSMMRALINHARPFVQQFCTSGGVQRS